MYENAIARLETEKEPETSTYLLEAMGREAVLLGTLEREEEASVAFERIVARYSTSTQPFAQELVTAARSWLESQEDSERTGEARSTSPPSPYPFAIKARASLRFDFANGSGQEDSRGEHGALSARAITTGSRPRTGWP
jgi:hypothetical protein